MNIQEAREKLVAELQAERPITLQKAQKLANQFLATGCLYNPRGVICQNKNSCYNCGWNPEVSKDRMKKILSGSKDSE